LLSVMDVLSFSDGLYAERSLLAGCLLFADGLYSLKTERPSEMVEMAMPDHAAVEKKVSAIQGYADLFKAAFPENNGAISIANIT
ncbi:hypothetical protein BWD08_11245, partial [Neisseria animaloris]